MKNWLSPPRAAVLIFSFLIAGALFVFNGIYTAPDTEGFILNLMAVSARDLLFTLLALSGLTAILLFPWKRFRRQWLTIFVFLITSSLVLTAGRAFWQKYQIAKFFGDYREGKIIFAAASDGLRDEFYNIKSFSLANRRFREDSKEQFEQALKKEREMLLGSDFVKWAPNSEFFVYEDVYDRDDLPKIFVANIKTGATILLTAGLSPFWIR